MSEKIVITDVGIAEVVNAEQSGTAPVTLSHIAFGTGQYTATKDMTALKSEFKRFNAISGGAIGDNVIHLEVNDYSADTYTVNEVGVFTESGALFAVCSQTTPIVQKASGSKAMLGFDFVFTDINPASVTVGDTNFVLNPATTETAGTVELATETEAKAGTDTTRAITPATLDATIEAHDNIVHRSGSETISGSKTFTGNLIINSDSPFFLVSQKDVVKGTIPDVAQYMGISFTDTEGHSTANRLALIETRYRIDGGVSLNLSAYKPEKGSTASSGIEIIYPATGSAYATAPTPASGDNSTKIATTAFVNTKAANYLPLAGGTLSGVLYSSNGNISYQGNTYRLSINGGTAINDGASLIAYGKNESNNPGAFQLCARDGTNSADIIGKPSGELTWKGKNLVRSVNGTNADASGNVAITSVASATSATSATKATQDGNGNVIADTYATKSYVNTEKAKYLPLAGGQMTTTKSMARDVNNSFLGLHGGTGENNDGAQLYLCGANHPNTPSRFQLHARNADKDVILQGGIDGVLEWDGKHVLNNSFLMPVDNGAVMLTAGTSSAGGAYFRLYGKDNSSGAGQFVLATTDGEKTNALTGKPDGTLTWNGKNIVIDPGITALSATSGTVSLVVNKIYTIAVSGTTTFSLPTPADKTVFNQIKVMMKVTGTPTINWGTTNFFNKSTPEIEEGSYDIYFDYDNLLGAWVCGVMAKGAAE